MTYYTIHQQNADGSLTRVGGASTKDAAQSIVRRVYTRRHAQHRADVAAGRPATRQPRLRLRSEDIGDGGTA